MMRRARSWLAARLGTRILALFLALIVVVELGSFVLIGTVGLRAARQTIVEEMVSGGRVFERVLEMEREGLLQAARLVAADEALVRAVDLRDRARIAAVLAGYATRVNAAGMQLVGADGRVFAREPDLRAGEAFAFPGLLEIARNDRQAVAMVVVDAKLVQVVIVPVPAARAPAWLAIRAPVSNALAQSLQSLTRLDISFLTRVGTDRWQMQATTLPAHEAARLVQAVEERRIDARYPDGDPVYLGDVASRVLSVPAHTNDTVVAVLQQPLGPALEPFRRLQRQIAWISLAALAVSLVGGVLIARGVAQPVRALARVAARIAGGDYSAKMPKSSTVEIAELARVFDTMQEEIAGRESRIIDLAYRDPLTGLPNRVLFHLRLSNVLEDARKDGSPVAVLLLDLDAFKDVNDTLGHAVGDRLLIDVAARLSAVVDPAKDTVARLGGDEFALMLPDRGARSAQLVARDVGQALDAPLILDGQVVDVRASIGVAAFPEHGADASTLLQRADVAMYAAKRNRLAFEVWDDRFERHSHERLSLMSELRRAVDAGALMLVYQPKVALSGEANASVEALLRWRHDTRGLVLPAEFIPFAEQTGIIRSITGAVLEMAVGQCAAWRAGGEAIDVSVNISARDLMDRTLPDRFAALLDRHRCLASWVSLEITESAIFDDPGYAIENLRELSSLGCRISIDDYGTGYSSLAYLRRLPLSELKIDRTFVAGMARDPIDAIIVRSTIDLAHNMGLRVVAEGVEDDATLDRLRALGCDAVQGFLFSRPIEADTVPEWFRREARSAAAGTISPIKSQRRTPPR